MPSWMWPEASSETTVPARKSPNGSLMGGSRSLADENNKAASARASRICETAIENRMERSAPHVR